MQTVPKRDARQRELKRAFKEQEKAEVRSLMLLDQHRLELLLDFLDGRLRESGCDETLRHTAAWALEEDVEFEALVESLRHFGGHCDCEVLANVNPEEIF